jgi:phage baseplate assembly protein W
MANITKIYSDIDFTFTRKPVVGDIALSYDSMAVVRSIRNLLLTKHYEKPFNPNIGSNIDTLLFEPISPITSSSLEQEIQTVIKNYEPRATLKNITVVAKPDKNAYEVSLSFYIENATLPTTVTILLERNR